MTQTFVSQVEALAKLRHEPPQLIIAEALERGMARLHQESVLASLLKHRLSRRRAIQLVGLEAVKLAEHQRQATQQDLAWGLRDA